MSVAGRKRICLTFEFEISRRIKVEDLLQLGHVCRGGFAAPDRRFQRATERERGEIQALTTATHARTHNIHGSAHAHTPEHASDNTAFNYPPLQLNKLDLSNSSILNPI